jgi:hypothetical protein
MNADGSFPRKREDRRSGSRCCNGHAAGRRHRTFHRRGFTHVAVLAPVVALAGAVAYRIREMRQSPAIQFPFVLAASHGVLDAPTGGGFFFLRPGWSKVTMRILLPAIMVLFPAALQAGGPIYKCETAEGKTIYQESPCAAGQKGAAKDVMPSAAVVKALPSGSKLVGNPPVTGSAKTMNEAYNRRMAKGDYDGALALATTEEQKRTALKRKAEKDRECDGLRITAARARADAKGRNQSWQNQADEEEARYSRRCK